MGAEQVASILRQAGQDSIRLVVARPVDPSMPQYAANSTIVPTKILTDPAELDRTLQSGLQQQAANGYAFEPPNGAYSEPFQTSMDVIPGEMPPVMTLTSADSLVVSGAAAAAAAVPVTVAAVSVAAAAAAAASGETMMVTTHNIPFPPSSTSVVDPPPLKVPATSTSQPSSNAAQTIVTRLDSTDTPQVTVVVPPKAEPEAVIQVHSAADCEPPPVTSSGQRVALVSSQSNPDHVSIRSIDSSGHTVTDLQCTKAPPRTRPLRLSHHNKEANKASKRCKTSVSCDALKDITASNSVDNTNTEPPINSSSAKTRKRSCPATQSAATMTTEEVENQLLLFNDQDEEEMINDKEENILPEKEEYKIELTKDAKGLGITVAGYVCEKEDLCGIFVKSVIEGSMADRSGCIMVNDQITDVDGVALSGHSNQEAVEILKQTGPIVKLTIVRYLRGLKFEELQEGITQANAATPTSPYPVTPATPMDNKLPGYSQQTPTSTCGSSRVTTSSLSGPSSQQPQSNNRRQTSLSSCSSGGGGTTLTASSSAFESSVTSSHQKPQLASNHMDSIVGHKQKARGSPMSRSLKHTTMTDAVDSPAGALGASTANNTPRRSVPNILDSSVCQQGASAADEKTASVATLKQQTPECTKDEHEKEALQLKWESLLGSKFYVVVARLRKPNASSGLGISLEGTVDVEDGKEVRPHHYIRSILPGGPIGLDGVLKSGDELLEVNGKSLKGLFHEEVVRSLKDLPVDVCMVCARKVTGPSPLRVTIVDNVDPGRSLQAFASRKILSGSLQSLLASKEPELLLKAKSEVSLACTTSQSLSVDLSTGGFGGSGSALVGNNSVASGTLAIVASTATDCASTPTHPLTTSHASSKTSPMVHTSVVLTSAASSCRKKSRSLEQLNSQAMWKSDVEEIELVKGEKGLGFSILDYQDPLNMSETVIVVRSLVPGGVAQVDGRLVPGDRIIYVNTAQLEHASLDAAVQALKGAPFGPVKIGIARPLTDANGEARAAQVIIGQLRDRLTAVTDVSEPPSTNCATADQTNTPTNTATCSTEASVRGSLSDTIGEGSNISDLRTDFGTDVDAKDDDDDEEVEVGDDEEEESDSDLTSGSSTVDENLPSALNRGELTLARDISILPHLPKYAICIRKAPGEFLGIQLEALAFELCGTLIRQIEPESSVAKDGRLRAGDLILYLNHESLWRVTSSQAKTVLRRAELVSTAIPIVFVPEEKLVPSTDSTEEDRTSGRDSPSESLKLSDIHEDLQEESSCASIRSEEIVPDLTVRSGGGVLNKSGPKLKRFPSDLLESSVDPDICHHYHHKGSIEKSKLCDQLDTAFGTGEGSFPPSPSSISGRSTSSSPALAVSTTPEAKEAFQTTTSTLEDEEEPAEAEQDKMVRIYNAPTVTSRHAPNIAPNGYQRTPLTSPSSPGVVQSPGCSSTAKTWGPTRAVDVFRQPGTGLGISIVGGKLDGGCHSGIFVKNVLPDSPAGRTGQLATGDRIIQVGCVPLTTSDQAVAVQAIKGADDPIRFIVQSLQPSSHVEQEHHQQKSATFNLVDHLDDNDNDVEEEGVRVSVDYYNSSSGGRRHSEAVARTGSPPLMSPAASFSAISTSAQGFLTTAPGSKSETQLSSSLYGGVKQPLSSDCSSCCLDEDNPFQNDLLPIWQQQEPLLTPVPTASSDLSNQQQPANVVINSHTSSPENNYGGQDQAYTYQTLNETGPASPDWAAHKEKLQQQQEVTEKPAENRPTTILVQEPPHQNEVEEEEASDEEQEDSSPKDEIIQAGLSDVERQTIQQKIQAEIQEKKVQHLTVYNKGGGEDVDLETTSALVSLDEVKSKKAKELNKEKDASSDEEEEEEEDGAADDDINRSENFSKLPGELIEVDLKRNDYGFGLALSGHKNRNRMGTFICGIHPSGAAFENGKLMVGDELLKVYKTVVRGRCHLNVSAIMKKVPNEATVRIVAIRNQTNMEKIAVKKFTQFPVRLDDAIFESPEFEIYKARREIKMQKTTEGLGIMIIEGAHKLLGKGIFVSDLQQNSLAFKASLKVGDMILAVNTESFLTVSYDEAALILKQVTGNVRILVVNPKDEEDKRNAPAASEEKSNDKLAAPSTTTTDAASKSPAKAGAAKAPAKTPAKKEDHTIELKKDANGLGISIVGGSDTPLGGVIVHEVYKDGAADKDGRIKPGDFIVSVDGKAFKECTHKDALRALRVVKDKVKIVIDPKHDSTDLYQDIEVELAKKAGKGLGLSVVGRRDGNGVFISDMVIGGVAETNGKLMRGDQILQVNDHDLSEAKQDEAVAILKTASGNVKLKVRRYKYVETK